MQADILDEGLCLAWLLNNAYCDVMDKDGEVFVYVPLNDCFGYATADLEPLPHDQIIPLYEASKRWGLDGIIAWAAVRRGSEPLEPLQTAKFKDAFGHIVDGIKNYAAPKGQ